MVAQSAKRRNLRAGRSTARGAMVRPMAPEGNAADRIDASRRQAAEAVCDRVIGRVRDARYVPPEALWAESTAYRAELAATLAIAGRLLDRRRCIDTAEAMLERLLAERVDGSLWSVGRWCEFPVYRGLPLDWRDESARPDTTYTNPIVVYCLGVYHRITGDGRFAASVRTSLGRMLDDGAWFGEPAALHHMTPEWVALACFLWRETFPDYWQAARPIVSWVRDDMVRGAPRDFPFFTAVRLHLLLAATGTRHLRDVIAPAIDALLADGSRRFAHDRRDFRHLAEAAQHVDVRANGALAVTMRLFDLAAGEQVYTGTDLYRHLAGWMDAMREPDGACYGCRDIGTGRRFCLGSPPHYIQLWWMLGGFYP